MQVNAAKTRESEATIGSIPEDLSVLCSTFEDVTTK
jgi:hypothetical protein